ncbi:MAG TPA: phosphatase PAP2 family protein [Acidimicrobiales bacterium]|nr:phosphatase PAP2 family protein [Acidimicrobiales bacterium]
MTVPLTDDRAGVRDRRDVAWLALGAVLLVVSALPVDEHSLSGAERSAFRAVNQVPGIPFAPVWLLMQAGNIAAVPLAAVAALVARRPRVAGCLVAAGALAYGGAKLVKEFVPRGRPDTLLADVEIHGAAAHGLGFVSGHAAVAVALAVVAFPYLGPRARWAVAALAVFVCVARVYVGAHLPLDVVGGAALGLVAGAAARLVFGRHAPCS